ncbi:MAG: phosphatase PAP2 family protein [Clostridia bacterium]|nr:phosphatase PAP2 family protein [Clostridia bacterium]
MSVLYFIENLRNPVFDAFFSFITLFGDETLFMAVAMIVFWCVNKKQGYYLFTVGFFGTVCNQFLKMVFRIPRPWVRDPNFKPIESAIEDASGYSFPSGHTQSSVGLFGGMARWKNAPWLRILSIVMCVLVPFSRLYLGVHTPADVLTSTAIALLLVFVGYPLFMKWGDKPAGMYTILGVLSAAVLALVLFLQFYPFPQSVYLPENIHNLESASENAYTLLGCMAGFFVVYTVDYRYSRFETKGVWWAQLIKIVVGLALVLAVKELTKTPLEWLIPSPLFARGVRYFLVVVTAGCLWPLTFNRFAKLGKKI